MRFVVKRVAFLLFMSSPIMYNSDNAFDTIQPASTIKKGLNTFCVEKKS